MFRYAGLEGVIRFLLQHTEARKIRWGPVFLVERSQVESFMFRKRLVGDNLEEE